MADRDKLAKFLNMLSADDMTALVAVRKIRDMAAAEKKLISDLVMVGPVVYQEKVVYREAAPKRGPVGDDIWEAMQRAAEQSGMDRKARAHQRRQAEEAAKQARRQQEYAGAFDDAEMTDEERAAARARGKTADQDRTVLDELDWAYKNEDDDLDWKEKEFAGTAPYQYRFDWELSDRQVRWARRIINKVKRNQGPSPI